MKDVVLPTLRARIALTSMWLTFFAWLLTVQGILRPIAREVTTLCYCDSLPYVRGELIYFGYLALATALPSYWLAFRIFRTHQTPLPGAYVFLKTEVRRGWRANFAALGWLTIAIGVTVGCIYAWIQLDVYELLNYERYSGCR